MNVGGAIEVDLVRMNPEWGLTPVQGLGSDPNSRILVGGATKCTTADGLLRAVRAKEAKDVVAPYGQAFGTEDEVAGRDAFDRLFGSERGIDLQLGGHASRRE